MGLGILIRVREEKVIGRSSKEKASKGRHFGRQLSFLSNYQQIDLFKIKGAVDPEKAHKHPT